VTLADASKGDTLQVVAVPLGIVGAQLLRLGIAKGSLLTCVLKIPGGPVVVRRGNMEVALGRKTASVVTVDAPDA
jgi:Fe2+ transport system protein FeoA